MSFISSPDALESSSAQSSRQRRHACPHTISCWFLRRRSYAGGSPLGQTRTMLYGVPKSRLSAQVGAHGRVPATRGPALNRALDNLRMQESSAWVVVSRTESCHAASHWAGVGAFCFANATRLVTLQSFLWDPISLGEGELLGNCCIRRWRTAFSRRKAAFCPAVVILEVQL